MKINLLFATILFAANVMASDTKGGGGGDACDKQIDSIRKDITTWIKQGGSLGLNVAGKDFTIEEYNQRMLEVLEDTKISAVCVKNEKKLTSVDGKPKTCVGYTSDDKVPYIVCDFTRFYKDTKPTDQYWLIHHEFAGIAGLEVNNGANSDYTLSAQLTDFLAPVLELKLGLKRQTIQNQVEIVKREVTYDELRNSFRISLETFIDVAWRNPHAGVQKIDQNYMNVSETLSKSEILASDIRKVEEMNHVKCKTKNSANPNWFFKTLSYQKLVCRPLKTSSFSFNKLKVKLFYEVNLKSFDNRHVRREDGPLELEYQIKRAGFKISAK